MPDQRLCWGLDPEAWWNYDLGLQLIGPTGRFLHHGKQGFEPIGLTRKMLQQTQASETWPKDLELKFASFRWWRFLKSMISTCK